VNPAERILRTLDGFMEGPGRVRLLGGAALILGYGHQRSTEDVDLIADADELQVLIDEANLGAALEATNRALEPEGLYLTHIWGPEQQILTPEWRSSCRTIALDLIHLTVEVLGPLDLILSKACRGDDGDLDDIRFLLKQQSIGAPALEAALEHAVVPAELADVFTENRARILALLSPL
jgi:hypothetical protein